MRRVFNAACGLILAATLTACGGPKEVGPGDNLLIGEWTQDSPISSAGGAVELSDGVVYYAEDGTSRMTAVMSLNAPELPESDRRYRMQADVNWTLDETVLTRTLGTITLKPETETEQSRIIAQQYEAGLNQSPPVRYIIETLDESTLALLDPDTGSTLRYTR